MYLHVHCTCTRVLLCRVSERPTSEEKSGVDLLGFLKGYGLIYDKVMEPHIDENNDDPVSVSLIGIPVCVWEGEEREGGGGWGTGGGLLFM